MMPDKRDELANQYLSDMEHALCICKDGWPRCDHKLNAGLKHQTHCPMHHKTRKEFLKKLKKYSLMISDLIIRNVKLEGELVKIENPEPISVDISHYYFHVLSAGCNDEKIREIGFKLFLKLAESMGAKIIRAGCSYGGSWNDGYDEELIRKAKPLLIKGAEGDSHYNYKRLGKADCSADHVAIFYSEERAHSFVDLGKKLKRMLELSFEMGKIEGASFLQSLSSGNITIDQFNEAAAFKFKFKNEDDKDHWDEEE